MLIILIVVTTTASVVYASVFEWLLHRFVMHRPFLGLTYPFKAHALTHHRIFKADETYHAKREEDRATIPMAWWNAPVLITLGVLPAIPLCFLFHTWLIVAIAALVFWLYYGAYEYLHWCMHLPLPKRRIVERVRLFFRLNGHHLLHHRYQRRNFNVVLPLADLLFRTLLLRSPVRFAQAVGPCVPDVQPKS